MNTGKMAFSQVMDHQPLHEFQRCVLLYHGHYKVKSFSCLDQYLCMAFAQLTYRQSLRDIETCLRVQQAKLYHIGIRGRVSHNTLANANEKRDWRIYADFAQALIRCARRLYPDEPIALELDRSIDALDSTIDLCLADFPWALFQQSKAAIKLHTLLDLRGNIPAFIHMSDGRYHDAKVLDVLIPEPGAFYVMDRGYIHFARLFRLAQAATFFVIRARANNRFRRLYSRPVDKPSGLRSDQTVVATGTDTKADYPDKLRGITYRDPETGKRLTFLTNKFALPALTIARLYKYRWQVELFFKWIKQHLRIKRFFGTSENAVKTQVWIAISIYVLVAIIKKRCDLEPTLYTILQIISVSVFEKIPLIQTLTGSTPEIQPNQNADQLNLFG